MLFPHSRSNFVRAGLEIRQYFVPIFYFSFSFIDFVPNTIFTWLLVISYTENGVAEQNMCQCLLFCLKD